MLQQMKSDTVVAAKASGLELHLDAAHTRIEKAFLDGGDVLVSVMDILDRLVQRLDHLIETFDGQTATTTIEGLKGTISLLSDLPDLQSSQQSAFAVIGADCSSTVKHVADMREIIRYLRIFAITMKVTGAGLEGFTEFSDEIRERIQSGSLRVDHFAEQLAQMRATLVSASQVSDLIGSEFRSTVPQIVADLESSAGKMAQQHQDMGAVAGKAKAVANGVKKKIAQVLSALQIGDVTRQRIEHIRAALTLIDTLQGHADEAPSSATRLARAATRMVNAQLQETVEQFQQQCGAITAILSSFSADATEIMRLHDLLAQDISGADRNVLLAMEREIAHACDLMARVKAGSRDGDAMVASVMETSEELLQGIEIIRAIKTDIHYMALNSSIRCARLGVAGLAVNVVSGELRIHAAMLEVPADAIVNGLRSIEASAKTLTSARSTTNGDFDGSLNEALTAIRTISGAMQTGLEAFAQESEQVFVRITGAVAKLDFQEKLGQSLAACVEMSQANADDQDEDDLVIDDLVQDISSQIFSLYTMAEERAIHRRFLPLDETRTDKAAVPAAADEDEFADLF
tara:strand:+ start:4703 stop:6424 length:1722 start_codon:yes stop_codon:yes gene_type:complete